MTGLQNSESFFGPPNIRKKQKMAAKPEKIKIFKTGRKNKYFFLSHVPKSLNPKIRFLARIKMTFNPRTDSQTESSNII